MQANKSAQRPRESGNAFALVMVGIVLFAALMYTFSRSARQGETNLSRKQIEVAAADILSYAQRVERGVTRAMSQGCSEDFISFEHAVDTSHPANPDAPTDNSCHVFQAAGGGVSPLPESGFPAGINIQASGGAGITGIGTDAAADLILWFSGISLDLCNELNRRVNIAGASPPVLPQTEYWGFGTDTVVPDEKWGHTTINVAALNGRNSGCGQRTGAPTGVNHLPAGYHFYYVLYPR